MRILRESIEHGSLLESNITKRHCKQKSRGKDTPLGTMQVPDIMVCMIADVYSTLNELVLVGHSNKSISAMWHGIDMARVAGNQRIRSWLDVNLGKRGRAHFHSMTAMDVSIVRERNTMSSVHTKLIADAEVLEIHRDTADGIGGFYRRPVFSAEDIHIDSHIRLVALGTIP